MSGASDRLLLVLPLRVFSAGGRLYTDAQACNGLRLWLKNFSFITLACLTEFADEPPQHALRIDSVEGIDRLTFVALPVAYDPVRFLLELPRTTRILSKHIATASYLHFAIGGLWGDWASVASLLASRAGLPFAVWTDRVESQLIAFDSTFNRGPRRLYKRLTARLMARYERHVIRRCALGLFHGMDCYKAYSPYCPNARLVHDIHLDKEARIGSSVLAERLARSAAGPLRIAYAGRVHREKGVYDWIDALHGAVKGGVEFHATWFGVGPDLSAAQNRVDELGLGSHVRFPGSTVDHEQLLRQLQGFDIFVFCHKTLESPRCLIEALLCGLPIVGYQTDYSTDLIALNGGGLLTPVHDVDKVSQSLISVGRDRALLRRLSEGAAQDGAPFTDEAVFRHRSDLMKTIRLGTAAASPAALRSGARTVW